MAEAQNDAPEHNPELAALSALLNQEEHARKRLRLIGILIPLVVALIAVSYLGAMYRSVRYYETTKLAEQLEPRLASVWPSVEKEFGRVGASLYPRYAELIANSFDQDIPNLDGRIDKELTEIRSVIDRTIDRKLGGAFNALAQGQASILDRKHPKFKKSKPETYQAVLEATRNVTKRWVRNKLATSMNQHLDSFKKLQDTLNKSFALAKGQQRRLNTEYVLGLWLDVMNEKLAGKSKLVPQGKSKR